MGVGGERQEHVLQPGAFGGPEHGEGDAQSLTHAEGVRAHATLGLRSGQADGVEHLVDAAARQAHGVGGDREDLAPGATGVLGGGVQEDAHLEAGVGEVGEAAPSILAEPAYLRVRDWTVIMCPP